MSRPPKEFPPDEPLSPADATESIRSLIGPDLKLHWTKHAKEQMKKRGLIMGDVLHILKHGFVYDEGEQSTSGVWYKYKMECTTPNSGGRTVKTVVIPSNNNLIKIITLMWKDEDTLNI